jgi:hypothetical protein
VSEEKVHELLEIIETTRCQLHTAYKNNEVFSDTEVYQLSLKLDEAIAEFQKIMKMHY